MNPVLLTQTVDSVTWLFILIKIERELEGTARLDAFGSCLLGWGMSEEFPVTLCTCLGECTCVCLHVDM